MQQQSQWSSSGSLTRKLKGEWWKAKLCTSCVSPLGRIIARGGHCKQCGLRVCKNCRHYDVPVTGQVSQNQQNWICILCSGSPPNYSAGGTLPKSGLGKSATKAIRRSWTISNPQRSGQQNSPILKSYTIYSENNIVSNNSRQFNSLPRLSYSQSIQDENKPVVVKGGGGLDQELNYSTLYPLKNNKSNSNSSVNLDLEEVFWDYYDYRFDHQLIDSSRSSCERSLGETDTLSYSYIIDPKDQTSQNVNSNPNGNPNVGAKSPVKPERSNKRSNSLNSYDGKRLSFSPLRTYVVLRNNNQQQQPSVTTTPTKKRSSSFNLDYCGKRNRANFSNESLSTDPYQQDKTALYSDLKRPFSETQLNCQINKLLKVSQSHNSDNQNNFKKNVHLDHGDSPHGRRDLSTSESDKLVREFIKEPLLNLKRQNIQKKIEQNTRPIKQIDNKSSECDSTDFSFNSTRKNDGVGNDGWTPSELSAYEKYQKQKKLMVLDQNEKCTIASSTTNSSPQSKQAKYFHKQVNDDLANGTSGGTVQCSKVSTTTKFEKNNSELNRIVKPPRKLLANNLKPSSKSPVPEIIYKVSSSNSTPTANGPTDSLLLGRSFQSDKYQVVSTTLPKSYKSRQHEYKNDNYWDSSNTTTDFENNAKSAGSSPNPGLENLLKKSEKILNPGMNVVQVNQTFPRRRKQQLKGKESPLVPTEQLGDLPLINVHKNNNIERWIRGHEKYYVETSSSSSCDEVEGVNDEIESLGANGAKGCSTKGWTYKGKNDPPSEQQVCDKSLNQIFVVGGTKTNDESNRFIDLNSQYAHDTRVFISDKKNTHPGTPSPHNLSPSQQNHQNITQEDKQFRNLRIIKGRSENEFVTTVQISNDMCHELNPVLRIYQPVTKSDIIKSSSPHRRQFEGSRVKKSVPIEIGIELEKKNKNKIVPSENNCEQKSDFVEVKVPQKIQTNNFFDGHSHSHHRNVDNNLSVDDTIRYDESTITNKNSDEFVNLSPSIRKNKKSNKNLIVEKLKSNNDHVQQSDNVSSSLTPFFDRDSVSAASTENSSDDTIIDCSQYNHQQIDNNHLHVDSSSDTLVDIQIGVPQQQEDEPLIQLQRQNPQNNLLSSGSQINEITNAQQQQVNNYNDANNLVQTNKSVVEKIKEFLTLGDQQKDDKDETSQEICLEKEVIAQSNSTTNPQSFIFDEDKGFNLNSDLTPVQHDKDIIIGEEKGIKEYLPPSSASQISDSVVDDWDEEEEDGIRQQLPPPLPPPRHHSNCVVDLQKRETETPIIKLNSLKEFEQLCDTPETRDNENLLELLFIFQKKNYIQNSRGPNLETIPGQSISTNFVDSSGVGGEGIEDQSIPKPIASLLPAIDITTQILDKSIKRTSDCETHEINFDNETPLQQPHDAHHHHNMNMMMEHNERLTPEGQESFTDDSTTTKRSSPDGEAIPGQMSKVEEENFTVTSSDSDNSWIEEIPYEEGPAPLDLTLHTIVEESCEESCDETESLKLGQSSSSRKPHQDDLENYFNYLDPASESRKLANEDSEFSDTFSESSFNSEVHQHQLGNDDSMMMDPVDLASTRLEKYFTNLSYNNNNPTEPYSEDSVGSESESDDHIKDKKKKVLKHKRASVVSDDESIFDLDEGNFDTIKKLPKKKIEKEKQYSHHHHQQQQPPTPNSDSFGNDHGMDYGSSSGIFTTNPGSTAHTPTTTKSKQVHLNRSNSFQWSSDEEVNLMMSKLRHLIKNLMQKSQTTSIESNSQLRYFETELIRLMRSEPELNQQFKNIVSEYISSEESDDNEFNQFIKDVVTQQQDLQQPLEYNKYAPWNKPTTTQINDPQQMTLGPNSSPALIAKVMHHIGKRLSDWMKDEEEEDGTLKCAPSVSSDLNEDRFSWKGSFESTLAAKRQSVGSTDSISSSDFNNQHSGAAVGVDRSILRSSSLHHLANSQPIEEKKEEEENISNSLPRLNQVTNMPRAQSLIGIKEKVKSARYRPPGFTQAPSIIKQIDDKMSMSTPAINVHQDNSSDTPLNLRSSADSISSMFDHGGFGLNIRGQIELSLQYNYKLASLEVRVKQCRDLAETKRNRSDPYVKAYLLPDRSKSGKRKTKTKKNTLNPIFEETLKFPLSLSELQSRTLWVSVWHNDIFGKNEFLGQVLINLKDRVFDDPNSLWWSLEEMSVQVEDPSRGDLILIVALKWQPLSESSSRSSRRSPKSLHSTLKWQPQTENRGALSILVKEAKNINLLTKNGCPSTFVKCSPLKEVNKNHRKQKTSVARRTIHPVWNQTLYFDEIPDDGVEVSLWNYDLLSNHDLIGTIKLDCNVPLWESMLNRHSFWVEGALKLDTGGSHS